MMLRSEYKAIYLGMLSHEEAVDFDRLLASIELKNFPYRVELERVRDQLIVTQRVKDRDDGSPKIVSMPFTIPKRAWWLGGALQSWVHDCVKTAVLHELDEAFHVDGVRVRDPHKEDR